MWAIYGGLVCPYLVWGLQHPVPHNLGQQRDISDGDQNPPAHADERSRMVLSDSAIPSDGVPINL